MVSEDSTSRVMVLPVTIPVLSVHASYRIWCDKNVRVLTKICILPQQSVVPLPSSTTDADVESQDVHEEARSICSAPRISAKFVAMPICKRAAALAARSRRASSHEFRDLEARSARIVAIGNQGLSRSKYNVSDVALCRFTPVSQQPLYQLLPKNDCDQL